MVNWVCEKQTHWKSFLNSDLTLEEMQGPNDNDTKDWHFLWLQDSIIIIIIDFGWLNFLCMGRHQEEISKSMQGDI